jgi:transcriptional regulator with XRE-family HTH domain
MNGYGEVVLRAREAQGWTQQQLADASGVPKRTIQEIEAGRVSKPQRATDLKLRQALEIEGDATRERDDWPADVGAIVDIVGAWLMTKTPAERIQWFSEFTRRTVGGE